MFPLLIFLSIISFDQLIKYTVRSQNYFYIINKGAAFSLGSQWWWFEWVVWGTFLGVLYVTYQTLHAKKQKGKIQNILPYSISFSLLLAGAVSNLIDRFFFNGVIDYFYIGSSVGKFPIFNLADISINIAILMWTWIWWRETNIKLKF